MQSFTNVSPSCVCTAPTFLKQTSWLHIRKDTGLTSNTDLESRVHNTTKLVLLKKNTAIVMVLISPWLYLSLHIKTFMEKAFLQQCRDREPKKTHLNLVQTQGMILENLTQKTNFMSRVWKKVMWILHGKASLNAPSMKNCQNTLWPERALACNPMIPQCNKPCGSDMLPLRACVRQWHCVLVVIERKHNVTLTC